MDLMANTLVRRCITSHGPHPPRNPRLHSPPNTHESTEAVEPAKSLARASGAVVAVSGAVDIVTDGERVVGAHNGVPMMTKITATGCSVTALVAAFVAVDQRNVLQATTAALSVFGVAGEMGLEMANGPGTL